MGIDLMFGSRFVCTICRHLLASTRHKAVISVKVPPSIVLCKSIEGNPPILMYSCHVQYMYSSASINVGNYTFGISVLYSKIMFPVLTSSPFKKTGWTTHCKRESLSEQELSSSKSINNNVWRKLHRRLTSTTLNLRIYIIWFHDLNVLKYKTFAYSMYHMNDPLPCPGQEPWQWNTATST